MKDRRTTRHCLAIRHGQSHFLNHQSFPPPKKNSATSPHFHSEPSASARGSHFKCGRKSGCPARKQVQQSDADPSKLEITYFDAHTCDNPPPSSSQVVPDPRIISSGTQRNTVQLVRWIANLPIVLYVSTSGVAIRQTRRIQGHLSTPLMRLLLALLLLVLPPPLREYFSASHLPKDAGVGSELHPVVLVPGLLCSDLEARLTEAYKPSAPRCGAMKGNGWFGLWKNASDLAANDYVDCFLEQMRLVYDPAINDYRNLPGVETRVPNFGSARGFHCKDPLHPKQCVDYVREGLERVGYRDGDTLFGAPYDWRYAPPVPGQQSQVYSRYFRQLKSLVETASKKHHKKVIIFGHSYGGMVVLDFVRNTPLAWRNEYIKHLILVAPVLSLGILIQAQIIAFGPNMKFVGATQSSLRTMWRSFETGIVDLPSPKVFGHMPLVITEQRNYSAYDMEDFLVAIGFGDSVEPFRRRMVPKMRYFKVPMVPVTCINGVGIRTAKQLVYWKSDYDRSPEIAYGDGDGTVNLISMLTFDKEMRRQPAQKKQFKSVKIHGAEHCGLITEEWAVKRVVQEFLEANRISS
ncbi:lecithin-cholesterol acyltransferase-like 1 [Setaria italica]|nr:lecithin-cholesterol acyltransferase-like 1 [Setaria italica]